MLPLLCDLTLIRERKCVKILLSDKWIKPLINIWTLKCSFQIHLRAFDALFYEYEHEYHITFFVQTPRIPFSSIQFQFDFSHWK